MTDRERQSLASIPADERGVGFLRLWTAKEAVLKAGGRGLGDGPSTVEAAELLWSDSSVVANGPGRWHVRQVAIGDRPGRTVVLAVADDRGRALSGRSPWSVGAARTRSTPNLARPPST